MKSRVLASAVAGVAAFSAAATATAAPVTVDVRVEGPTTTLLEQRVTVDTRTFKFTDGAQSYTCDGTGPNGTTTTPSPTRNGALAEAAERGGVELLGSFGAFGPSFTRINGEPVAYDAATGKYLVEYKNGIASQFGGCADPIATGDDVLFAYGDGTEPLLRLSGTATVTPGAAATLTVRDQATQQPVAGATVAGAVSGADGTVTTAPLTRRGLQTFKATKAGAIRSNAVTVCVTDGHDGFCGSATPGTPAAPAAATSPVLRDVVAAFGQLGTVRDDRRYAAGHGPRTLAGTVGADPAGLRDVRLRLSRTSGGTCSRYDGARERFVRTRACGIRHARTFAVGTSQAFSYLLPARLTRGRYVLDVVVRDRAGNQTQDFEPGRNRAVFHVG